MNRTIFSIGARWKKDGLASMEIAQSFLTMLRNFDGLSPAMDNWVIPDAETNIFIPLADATPNMTALVENWLDWDDNGDADPDDGRRVVAMGSEAPNERGAKSVSISVHAGSRWTNDVKFQVGSDTDPADPSLVTYPMFRGVLEGVASAWPCPWVFAYSWTPDDVPIVPWDGVTPLWEWRSPQGRYREPFEVAWIAYLSASLATGLTSPPELLCERTPGGGMILSSVTERLDETKPDHMRRARMLEAILNERVGAKIDRRLGVEHPARIGPY